MLYIAVDQPPSQAATISPLLPRLLRRRLTRCQALLATGRLACVQEMASRRWSPTPRLGRWGRMLP
jgi:hypothetical protein